MGPEYAWEYKRIRELNLASNNESFRTNYENYEVLQVYIDVVINCQGVTINVIEAYLRYHLRSV